MRCILSIAFLIPAILSAAIPKEIWKVNTERTESRPLTVIYGETRDIEVQFLNYNAPLDLTGYTLTLHAKLDLDEIVSYQIAAQPGRIGDAAAASNGWGSCRIRTESWLPAGLSRAYYTLEARNETNDERMLRGYGELVVAGTAASSTNNPVSTGGTYYVSQIIQTTDIKPSGSGIGTVGLLLTPYITNLLNQGVIAYQRGPYPTNFLTSSSQLNGAKIMEGSIKRDSIDPELDTIYRSGGGNSGGGVGTYTNTSINGVTHSNAVNIADGDNLTWALGTDGVWRASASIPQSWSSTGTLYWVVNGETIGRVDSNGITMLKGSLSLYQEDLNCNVRLYDGTRLNPSLTPQGHPGTWGLFFKSYNSTYSAFWSQGSNEIGTLNGSGITLTRTNTAFNGAHIGDISQTTGYPEYLFASWITSPSVHRMSITNSGKFSVYNSDTVQVFSINGTNGDLSTRGIIGANRYGVSSGINATGINWTAYGIGAGLGSTGNNWSASGFGAGSHVLGNSWSAIGWAAGNYSTGDSWDAFGSFAGQYAAWSNSTAIGRFSGFNARGTNRIYIDNLSSNPGTNYNAESNSMIFGDDGDLYIGRPDKKATLRSLSVVIANCPTTSTYLVTGNIWNSNGFLRIIP